MPGAAVEITVNAVDAPRAVAFWAAALGYRVRHVRPPYTSGPDKLPLALQDHNHPVRYRNIWIRNLQ